MRDRRFRRIVSSAGRAKPDMRSPPRHLLSLPNVAADLPAIRRNVSWLNAFGELYEARERILESLSSKSGVEWIDIDEVANRVVVGVSSQQAKAMAEAFVRAGPDSMLIRVGLTGRTGTRQKLTDKVRPVVGGTELTFTTTNQGIVLEPCTLGYNVRLSGEGRGILTASHCTVDTFDEDSWPLTVYQSSQGADSHRIAREDVDPWTFGHVRYADVAFVYNDPGEITWYTWGVAQPLYSTVDEDGPTDIWSSDPRFEITGRKSPDYQIVGRRVEKVGFRTGWTYGEVTRTCVHHSTDLELGMLVCQWHADLHSRGGDSGAPVGSTGILAYGSTHAWPYGREWKAYGVLWGGPFTANGTPIPDTTYYSTLDGVETDLGDIDLW